MPMNRNLRRLAALAVVAMLIHTDRTDGGEPQAPTSGPPEPTPIVPVDDIRVGMTGYGLTVFHGTTIEPFAVEVVSVMRGFAPQRAVIWIRCPEERLQKTGAVSGMSGSPIYLWRDGEPHVLGQGGGLIGAFAYGFQAGKDCYAGVQPIQDMRAAAERALAARPAAERAGGHDAALRNLRHLLSLARSQRRLPAATWRVQTLLEALGAGRQIAPQGRSSGDAVPSPLGTTKSVAPLAVPLGVPSAAAAELLEPFLEGSGIQAMWGGAISGTPPAGIDVETIRLEPGAVLGIPLLWGDLDLAASGTVTEVLPNHQVLGLGHALLGQGAIALPMSNGYVHYVFPSIVQSFKLTGSGAMRGSLVADEQSAVIGSPEQCFQSAAITVHVRQPGQPPRTYRYQVARHRRLTPPIAALAAMESLTAVQDLPLENTLQVTAQVRVDGPHALKLNGFLPQASAMDAALLVLPPLQMLADNDYQTLLLTDLDMQLTVQPTVQELSIVSAAAGRSQVRPGESVEVALQVQPRGGKPYEQRLHFAIPEDLPDGDYELVVSGAQGYLDRLLTTKPHLFDTQRLEDLLQVLQLMGSVEERAYYMTMSLPGRKAVAVGRQELADLPSSRRALLTRRAGSGVSDFSALLENRVPCDRAVQGNAKFVLTVKRELKVD